NAFEHPPVVQAIEQGEFAMHFIGPARALYHRMTQSFLDSLNSRFCFCGCRPGNAGLRFGGPARDTSIEKGLAQYGVDKQAESAARGPGGIARRRFHHDFALESGRRFRDFARREYVERGTRTRLDESRSMRTPRF